MPDRSIGFLLSDIARLLRRRFEAALEEAGVGLTLGEARTLAFVRRMPDRRQAVLAEFLGVEPMTLVGYLDRLETAGLVLRRPDPCDRRAKLVSLAEGAAPIMARIDTALAAVRGSALAGFSDDDVARTFALLEGIQANLAGGEGTPRCGGGA